MVRKIKDLISNIYIFLFCHSVWEERERKCSFGERNPDKVFYVIRFDKGSFGLMTIWKFVLAHIEYAKKNGYIPVIDLKNYYSEMIQNAENKGKQNAWEYYFDQPSEYKLEEVYSSKNVILAKKNVKLSEGVQLVKLPMDNMEFQFWTRILSYIPIKKEIELTVQKIKKELFPKGKKILGASARFEYTFLKESGNKSVNGHPIQPSVYEFAKDVKQYMIEWGCDYCFLAIDDKNILEVLKENLGDKAFYYKDKKRGTYWFGKNAKKNSVDFYEKKIEDIAEELSIGYLIELLLLAECDCFLAGKSSGNIFAYLKNGQRYEHISIYEKGVIDVR